MYAELAGTVGMVSLNYNLPLRRQKEKSTPPPTDGELYCCLFLFADRGIYLILTNEIPALYSRSQNIPFSVRCQKHMRSDKKLIISHFYMFIVR